MRNSAHDDDLEGILSKMHDKLWLDYFGRDRAHLRDDLLTHLKIFYPWLTDRKMREIYSQYFPIAYKGGKRNKAGIYIPDTNEEYDKAIKTMMKTRDTYGEKIMRYEQWKFEAAKRREQRRFREMEQLRLI